MNVQFETKQGNKAGTHEWLTPPHIIKALGEFDLDPCAPAIRPWDMAKKHYTIEDDGLMSPWEGRVWCNPPYGDHTAEWLKKCYDHGNAIVLTFARVETKMFFTQVWSRADAIFFFAGRLQFISQSDTQNSNSAGAPSCLIAYGANNVTAILRSDLKGKLILLKT